MAKYTLVAPPPSPTMPSTDDNPQAMLGEQVVPAGGWLDESTGQPVAPARKAKYTLVAPPPAPQDGIEFADNIVGDAAQIPYLRQAVRGVALAGGDLKALGYRALSKGAEVAGMAAPAYKSDINEVKAYFEGLADQEMARNADMSQMFAKDTGYWGGIGQGISRSVASMVPTAMVAGPAGAIGSAVGVTGNQAREEGMAKGLEGADLTRYVTSQMIMEGVPAAAMQMVGLGGVEKQLTQPIKRGIQAAFKQSAKSLAEEVPEEVITALGQELNAKLAGVKGGDEIDFYQAGFDAAVSTIGTVGLVGAARYRPAKKDDNAPPPDDEGEDVPDGFEVSPLSQMGEQPARPAIQPRTPQATTPEAQSPERAAQEQRRTSYLQSRSDADLENMLDEFIKKDGAFEPDHPNSEYIGAIWAEKERRGGQAQAAQPAPSTPTGVEPTALQAFPEMIEVEGGGYALNSFSPIEMQSARDAGIVITNSNGHEVVDAQALWEQRKAFQALPMKEQERLMAESKERMFAPQQPAPPTPARATQPPRVAPIAPGSAVMRELPPGARMGRAPQSFQPGQAPTNLRTMLPPQTLGEPETQAWLAEAEIMRAGEQEIIADYLMANPGNPQRLSPGEIVATSNRDTWRLTPDEQAEYERAMGVAGEQPEDARLYPAAVEPVAAPNAAETAVVPPIEQPSVVPSAAPYADLPWNELTALSEKANLARDTGTMRAVLDEVKARKALGKSGPRSQAPTAPVEAAPAPPTPTPVQPEIVAPRAAEEPLDTSKPIKAVHYSRTPMRLKKGTNVSKIKGAYPEESTFGPGFYAMELGDEPMWKDMARFKLGDHRNAVDLTPSNPLIISPDTVKERGFDAIKAAIDSGEHDAIISRGWSEETIVKIYRRTRELWKPRFPEGETDGKFLNGDEYDKAHDQAVREVTGMEPSDYKKLDRADWAQNQIFIPTDSAPDVVQDTGTAPPTPAKPKRTPPPAKGSTSSTGWSTVAKGVARKDIMGRNVEIVRQADGSWSVTRDEQEMDSGYKSRADAEKYADGELAQDIRDQRNAEEEERGVVEEVAQEGVVSFEDAKFGDVYKVRIGQEDRYAVRENIDNPRGGGDPLYSSFDEARTEFAKDQERKSLNASRQAEGEAKRKEQEDKDNAAKTARTDIRGFMADKPILQQGRVRELLTGKPKYQHEGERLTGRDLVEKLVSRGYEARTVEDTDHAKLDTAYKKLQNTTRMTAQEQRGYESTTKNPPKKTYYRMYSKDGDYLEVSKVEHDYAKHLSDKSSQRDQRNAEEEERVQEAPVTKPATMGKKASRKEEDRQSILKLGYDATEHVERDGSPTSKALDELSATLEKAFGKDARRVAQKIADQDLSWRAEARLVGDDKAKQDAFNAADDLWNGMDREWSNKNSDKRESPDTVGDTEQDFKAFNEAAAARQRGQGPAPADTGTSAPEEDGLIRAAKMADLWNTQAQKDEGGRGIAAGAENISYRWAADSIRSMIQRIRAGTDPDTALAEAKAEKRQWIERHNSKRPKDIAWKRDKDSADDKLESAWRLIKQSNLPSKADTGIFRDLTAAARAGQRFVEDLHVRIAPTLARIHAAAKSPVEFVRAAVSKIGEHIRPYARRFLADVRKVNAEFAANPTRGSVPKDAKRGEERKPLANPGTTPDARGFVEKVDEERLTPDEESRAKWEAEANKLDKKEILEKLKTGETFQTAAEVIAGKRVTDEAAWNAIQTGENIADSWKIADAWRRTGTAAARVLAARYDPILSASERAKVNKTTAEIAEIDQKMDDPSVTDAAFDKLVEERMKAVESINDIKMTGTARRMLAEIFTSPRKSTDRSLKSIDKKLEDTTLSSKDRQKLNADREYLSDREGKALEKMRQRMLASGIPLDNPREMRKRDNILEALREAKAHKSTFIDKVEEIYKNIIFSASTPKNLISNAAFFAQEMGIVRPIEAALNSAIGIDPRAAKVSNLGPMITAIAPGLRRGVRNMIDSWRTEADMFELQTHGPNMNISGKLESRGAAIPGKTGRFVRSLGYRPLMATDSFNKSLIAEIEVANFANSMATEKGLKGRERVRFIQRQTLNYDSASWRHAVNVAERLTLTDESGPVLRWVTGVRDAVWPLRFLIPIVKTPAKEFKAALQATPLGTGRIAYKLYRDKMYKDATYTKKELARDVAEQTAAWTIAIGLLAAFSPGDDDDTGFPLITGNQPYSRNKAAENKNKAAIAPPKSIRIGDRWYSYAALGVVSTELAAVVDALYEIPKADDDPVGALSNFMVKFMGNAKDQTFLSNLNDLLDAFEEGGPTKWAGNFAASWSPSMLKRVARGADPIEREMKAMTPAERLNYQLMPTPAAPAKVDLFGRTVKKAESPVGPRGDLLWRVVGNTQITDMGDRTPLENDLYRMLLNWNNKNPDDKWAPQLPEVDYKFGQVEGKWTPKEYERLSTETGKRALELLTQINDAKPFNFDSPTIVDRKRFDKAMEVSRKYGRGVVLREKVKAARDSAK